MAKLLYKILITTLLCSTFSLKGLAMQKEIPSPIELYKGPILIKIVGGIAKLKETDKVIKCELTKNHSSIKDNLLDINELIHQASKKQFTTAFHFRPQVPTIEIYAILVDFKEGSNSEVVTKKILLVKDYETLKQRAGKEAERLINIVNNACK